MIPLVNRIYSTDTPRFSDDLPLEEDAVAGLRDGDSFLLCLSRTSPSPRVTAALGVGPQHLFVPLFILPQECALQENRVVPA